MLSNAHIDASNETSTPYELTDEMVVGLAQNGDTEAFGVLFKRHERKVRSIVRRFVRQPADIEDLTQDVFLKALVAIPRFRGDSQFFTWLYRIAFNTGIKYSTSGCRAEVTNTDDLEQSTGIDPEKICIDGETRTDFDAAMERLPFALREALALNTLKGFDYESVGQMVDCPIGTVRSRIFRAREAVSAAVAS